MMELLNSKRKYIDPRTDFGFKRLFGKESNKELLIHFLNALLEGQHKVVDLRYLPMERIAQTGESRNAVFDVFCRDEHDNAFIVEMQNAYQRSFKSRSIFYSTFPIQEGVQKGLRDFTFPPVYTICLLNFRFDEPGDCPQDSEYITRVKLVNLRDNRVFFDGLNYIYVELPKFEKTLDQLSNDTERWLYLLKNTGAFFDRPEALQERVFTRFFEQAEIAAMTHDELHIYLQDRFDLRSYYDSLDSAEERGVQKGLEQGRQEGIEKGIQEGIEKGIEEGMEKGRKEAVASTARKLKELGLPIVKIQDATGLSEAEIAEL